MTLAVSLNQTIEQFNTSILKKQDETLTKKWEKFKTIFAESDFCVNSQHAAGKIFSNAIKISRHIQDDKEITQLWTEILNNKTFKLPDPDFPVIASCTYDFKCILTQLKNSRFEEPVINIVQLTEKICDEDGIMNIANAFDNIAKEAVSFKYGSEHLKKMFQDKTTLCFLAKHEGVIVGCIAGSYLEIPNIENQWEAALINRLPESHLEIPYEGRLTDNVLHIWFLGRKADYPSLRLYEFLVARKGEILERFPNLQYLTWNTIPEEAIHFKEIEKIGYDSKEHIDKGFLGRPMDFHTKNIQGDFAIIKREQVRKAMTKNRERILSGK